MKKLLHAYFATPLVYRIIAAFLLGIGAGIGSWLLARPLGTEWLERATGFVSPFGTVLISMLKMAVIPIIFFSLVTGAASLPLKKFGKLGLAVIVWYFLTSLFASVFGTALAIFLNPAMKNTGSVSESLLAQASQMKTGGGSGGFGRFINELFMNPFQALAEGRFLPIIVFSILFGLAARAVLENYEKEGKSSPVNLMLDLFDAAQVTSFKIIDWIMEYFPIGVFALTAVNFALYGTELFGPYLRIAGCVIAGVLMMIFVIYPLFILVFTRENPYSVLSKIKEPIITAFLTRSSAATLPISFLAAEDKLHVKNQLSGFALPLGATINMDGVCIHLPVFAVLAANIFGIPLGIGQIFVLVVSVIFASVGAGGIPGGSIFLLFMVLSNMGLSDSQTATVVALAIGINPLMDMFETACNVAGDNVGNYIVAKRMGMIETPR